MTSTQLRKLVLGKHPFIPSHAEYKRAVLTGQLCILTIIICLVFFVIDLTQAKYYYVLFEFGCALVAFVGQILNRQGKHTMAKVLLITGVNLTTYLLSESEPMEIGLYLFFIVTNIGTIAIFGFEERKMMFFFISLSMTLFLLSLFTDITVVPKVVKTDDYVTFNILINFIVSFVSSSVIIYFLINLNYRSESALKENERQITIKNDELTKVNAELDRFMYSTSHDLRSPISSVLGLIQLVKMTNNPEEIKRYIEMMEGRLASLNKFIKDISDYSRNARTGVDLHPVLVHKMVNDIVENLKFYPGAEKMKVYIEIDRNFEIHTDPTRLQLILSNLISNSFKYVDPYKENPFIKIIVKSTPTHVQFQIEDNGVGIPENFLPRIFDMFFQAHEKSEGSGLGLYIVKEAICKLNGTIDAISKLDVGSQFNVSLPV